MKGKDERINFKPFVKKPKEKKSFRRTKAKCAPNLVIRPMSTIK